MPFNLLESLSLLSQSSSPSTFSFPSSSSSTSSQLQEIEIPTLTPSEQNELLDGVIESVGRIGMGGRSGGGGTGGEGGDVDGLEVFLEENQEELGARGVWVGYGSLIKYADSLPPSLLSKLLDSLTSTLTHLSDSLTHFLDNPQAQAHQFTSTSEEEVLGKYKEAMEVMAFMVYWMVGVGERVEVRGGKVGAGGGGGGDEEVVVPAGGRGKKKAPAKSTKSAAASKNATSGTWSWADHIPLVLNAMHRALRVKTERVWRGSGEREGVVNCFTKSAYQIAETESHLKSQEIRLGVYKVICLAVKFHGHGFGAQTSIMQNLTYFEHLSEPMAELLTILEKEFDHTQLTEEILREVSQKQFNAAHQDAKGPRSFSRFLVKLAELSPRLVQKQMSLLLTHLDSEAHPMRMSMIEIIGLLIRDISLSDEGDEEAKKKQIKAFFELLYERFLDLNSWVRSKLLTTLIKICDLPNKFPKQRHRITELTIRSLEDKAASVRRYSLQLLCRLLETHPFGQMHGGTLHLGEWQERYEILTRQLDIVDRKEMEEARRNAGLDEEEAEEMKSGRRKSKRAVRDSDDEDEEGDEDAEKAEAAVGEDDEDAEPKVKAEPEESQGQSQSQSYENADLKPPAEEAEGEEELNIPMDPESIMRLRLTKKYYADALRFIRQLENAVPVAKKLLTSTSKAEVLESMRFFRLAYEYNLESAEIGIKTMLHLIWSKDNNSTSEEGTELKGIRSNLIDVYKSLYFDVVPDLNPKQQVNRIAKNMIERTYEATLAELTSLEELMRTMMADNGVHNDVVNKLWQVYGADQEIPRVQRRGAIIILGMLALAKREVVTERVDTLLRVGLGPLGKADLVLARYTCIALQRLSGSAKKVKGSLVDKTMRLPMDSPVFEKLREILESQSKSSQWFSMAEQAFNTIYLLGEQPDILCGDIIQQLHVRVFSRTVKAQPTEAPEVAAAEGEESQAVADSQVESQQSQVSAASGSTASSIHLAQLLFAVGHVAVKHIVYLELVEREVKRQKDETAKAKAASKTAEKDSNDLDAVTGNAEDDIGDLIASIRERELLYGEHSLLAAYGPLVAHVCATPKTYNSPSLREAAVLAMSKLMCVSAQYCEEHLPLLFKIMETSKDAVVRSNIVIALGDIAVCFSNMIDENSDRLYQGLADKDLVVKKNTLMVLTHLILNGMIKVKGQLGEMAKCLEDEEPRISDLAKLFFTELSTKDNALYNNLQDVISHLSVGKHAVDEETFERTMRFIFTFIEKEKQAESIVEKLCQRFRLADAERQWREIAFCLSLLPFKSERSMKRLIEGLPFYHDKLHEETVFKRFNEILAKARGNKASGKPEAELKEFEIILEEHRAKGEEEHALAATAVKKAAKAKRTAKKAAPTPRKAPQRKTRRRVVEESEEEEEEEEEVEE